ncbi:MAG TPA: type II secretion system F family protein, partial [Candidatus Omnitrophica bacterium]|nr:type II secretion system F family protein [Candidatus Omnitrophota bacterium]
MVTQKTLAHFYHQFTILLDSGIDIIRALDSLKTTVRNNQLRETILKIQTRIQRGASLTEAMSYHPEIFSQFHLR